MRKQLIQEISQTYEITNQVLIEKDIILHEILTDLTNEEFFIQNFLFKGGTCLVKAFLNYIRFSEDMDFTWKDQSIFQGKSGKQIRKNLSELLAKTAKILENISQKRGLDFKYEKDNSHYVELGGSNKMCTFYLWYTSEITNIESFLKVQINFVEKLLFSSHSKELESLGTNSNESLKTLFEDSEYLKKIEFPTYDPKEILCEKIRAILTRKGIKARDFIDIFFICEKFSVNLEDVKKESVEKFNFALENYEKYRDNMKEKMKQLESENFFELGEEENLLLQKIDKEKFYSFTKDLGKFLNTVIPKEYHDPKFSIPISAVCSGADGAYNIPHSVYLPNPENKRFDQIDLSKEKCPKCGLIGTMQAFPF
ncbi:nucleotidyl transferase AbiEii/AbiGii toxin family protein [Nitrosopumilus sp. b2]|uniref:nucleotidyl transferase AbiEii/AbiGii toxin family protein n=1 Tax=Nitrosopumilus sp. b2 TaxID=2109908 RepID=UPI0015F53615|nr:nucleotidyl transferase AbiEii/AbiGii toxin family protein [Nitrosopumilus sp. b2]